MPFCYIINTNLLKIFCTLFFFVQIRVLRNLFYFLIFIYLMYMPLCCCSISTLCTIKKKKVFDLWWEESWILFFLVNGSVWVLRNILARLRFIRFKSISTAEVWFIDRTVESDRVGGCFEVWTDDIEAPSGGRHAHRVDSKGRSLRSQPPEGVEQTTTSKLVSAHVRNINSKRGCVI